MAERGEKKTVSEAQALRIKLRKWQPSPDRAPQQWQHALTVPAPISRMMEARAGYWCFRLHEDGVLLVPADEVPVSEIPAWASQNGNDEELA